MEKDDEVKGIGNSLDFGARIYDSRLARWMSLDPFQSKYPDISPFAFVANSPLIFIDPDGRKIKYVVYNEKGVVLETLTYKKGNFYHKNGTRYDPSKESLSQHLYQTLDVFRKIESSGDANLIHKLKTIEESERTHYIRKNTSYQSSSGVLRYIPDVETLTEEDNMIQNGQGVGTITYFNFSKEAQAVFKESEGVSSNKYTTGAHELQHMYDFDQGCMADNQDSNAKDPAEIRAVYTENLMRKVLGLKTRTTYGGEEIDPDKLKDTK